MNAQLQFSTAYQDEIPNYRSSGDVITTLSVGRPRVRVANPKSSWVKELEDRFNELTSLPKGWDGYKGVPVAFNCAQFAANLIERLCVSSLPAPQLVPMSDGTIRLEWHMNQFDIEIDVSGPYDVFACRTDLLSDEEDEIEIQTDFTELSNWISELAVERNGAIEQVGG